MPSDVIATTDGGLAVSDTNHDRVRRIAPDGTITTIAGGGSLLASDRRAEGKSATNVRLERPVSIAQFANGDIALDDASGQIYRVARDGTFHSVLDISRTRDFAGRRIGPGYLAAGLATTREGGLLIAAGDAYYLAPDRTGRTLVAIRNARVSGRQVTALSLWDAARARDPRLRRAIARSRAPPADIRPAGHPLRVSGRFSRRPTPSALRCDHPTVQPRKISLKLYASDRLQMA